MVIENQVAPDSFAHPLKGNKEPLRCDAIVLHSGGMDSSLCLALALERFGKDRVLSVGFCYNQRHSVEIQAAQTIADHLGVQRHLIDILPIPGWEASSLVNTDLPIKQDGKIPNSFVVGRNGLFLMMAAPLLKAVGAKKAFIGVMELEGSNSGYPDCSRAYIDSVQKVIALDIQDPDFSIETPLISMSKFDTMQLADRLALLDFLLLHTVTCYEGEPLLGCKKCPACLLRNEGVRDFYKTYPEKRAPEPYNLYIKGRT